MKKRNAFTLVELLAVIVVLAIVLIIAVPGVLSIMNKTKDSAYDRQIEMIKDAAKNYVTANTITWSGDNPKSTLVTLDMLQSGGYLDKKILDPRNKKEILCANVLVTKDNKNKITYDVDMTCNEVQPITPRVGSGMIPIVYKDGNWVKADSSNKDFAWFNYGNQQWANVATVTEDVRQTLLDAPVGTEVPMDKINTMFVWIPRFKYKLFNVDGTIHADGNKNLRGNRLIDVQFETASTTKSKGTQNGQWLTHPAFTFGGQELEGFWVAKFETGYKDATTTAEAVQSKIEPSHILIKPNIYSWTGQTTAQIFHNLKDLKKETTVFGFTAADDSHAIKNMEWGAIAYLTRSNYGKYFSGKSDSLSRPFINNNSNHITGCAGDTYNASISDSCNSYETKKGIEASTTGNISGVYDMAGNTSEVVMAIQKDRDNRNQIDAGLTSFTPEERSELYDSPYLDLYEYDTSWDQASIIKRGHLGDATLETAPYSYTHPEGDPTTNINCFGWSSNFCNFIWVNRSKLTRGGSNSNVASAGIYNFYSMAESDSTKNTGSRVILF